MGIFNKLLQKRLALVLTCCIMVITLLVGAQLFLHGARAQGGVSPLAKPTFQCHTHKSCAFLASAGFSTTQGLNQWNYQFSQDQEATFVNMTYDSTGGVWQGSEGGCMISSNWQHPGFAQCDSARTWVAPYAGSVTLTANGDISVATNCPNSTNTNGVQIRVLLNGVQLWPTTGWQAIANGATFTFPSVTASVQATDQLQFVVAHVGPNNECDSTTWDQLVTLVRN